MPRGLLIYAHYLLLPACTYCEHCSTLALLCCIVTALRRDHVTVYLRADGCAGVMLKPAAEDASKNSCLA